MKTLLTKEIVKEYSYYDEANENAKEIIMELANEIREQLIANGEASTDIVNDYESGDRLIYESDNQVYDLEDESELINELREYEETDEGLWEGLKPEDAISVKASYTKMNAVYDMTRKYIEEINETYKSKLLDTDEIMEMIKEII